jgi:hypothetical protein
MDTLSIVRDAALQARAANDAKRAASGFERRVAAARHAAAEVQAHIQSGLSAAEATRLVRSGEGAPAEPTDQPALQDAAELRAALDVSDA